MDRGETTASMLAGDALERIADPHGEGSRAFLRVYGPEALNAARLTDDTLRATGRRRGPLDGITVSIKDLFDVAGETTLAGSRVRENEQRAAHDSEVVRRLRDSGAVVVGRTNMTEFAYSGLGINPHYGTPLNPWDRKQGRIPGGSSSGAAVSVSDGMAMVAVATDTGGSARIPAAFCGLTGFKPTAARIPLQGVFPLSPSLDSVGSIGTTVECCALLDAVLSGSQWQPGPDVQPRSLRLGVVMDYMTTEMDASVTAAYERALSQLSGLGVQVQQVHFPELLELPGYNQKGGFAAYESWRQHCTLLEQQAAGYDPRVAVRILRGQAMYESDYRHLLAQRKAFIQTAAQRFEGFDALVAPTVPIVAPTLAECEPEDAYGRLNLLALRNPSVVNFMDGCAVSLPCHRQGDAPVGLMLFQTAHADQKLLSLACVIERLLNFHGESAIAL